MKEIKFNTGRVSTLGGGQMEVVPLINFHTTETVKEKLPWFQIFDCGFRVNKANLDWKFWNGCVFADIDSKKYYTNVKQFDCEKLEEALYNTLFTNDEFCYNFFAIQRSHSGNSYHIIFYFDVDKTETNFKKCVQKVKENINLLFEKIGHLEIIQYPGVIDKCCESPTQGFYVTHHQFKFGNYNDNNFGYFGDIDKYELEETYIHHVSDVKEDGTKLFELKGYTPTDVRISLGHKDRLRVLQALKAVYEDEQVVAKHWEYICTHHLIERDHNIQYYINEGKQRIKYTYNVNVDVLKQFGYSFEKIFEPTKIDLYEPDIEYTLTENQNLSDIDIKWSYDKINHLYAGCSLGKTYNAKELGKQITIQDIDYLFGKRNNKVCFISPMRSINKDSFTDIEDWVIVDSDHKEKIKDVYTSIRNAINKEGVNVCTTWESFVIYEMFNINFDYVIVDEAHTLFMYDYRTTSITNIKEALKSAHGIRILMTGTPSAEVKEFDCYKIKVNKKLKEVDVDLVLYNESFLGYYMNDIREWTVDPTHYAIIFNDVTNYKTTEQFNGAGLDCDIFNTNYTENVEYILTNHNVKKQITAFSVYGQAGINLYIDIDKKLRIYILNKNGLGIIQYANRVRNREVIDKIVIGYKKSNVDNNIKSLSYNVDYSEAYHRIEQLNSIKRVKDIFEIDVRNKEILKLRWGLYYEYLERVGDQIQLIEKRYATYSLIKNVQSYENQIQIIYNRLIDNHFKVNIINLSKDIKDIKSSKLRRNQFAGQMTRFNFDQFIEKKDGTYWFKPNEEFKKICTGDLCEKIEKIFNMLIGKFGGFDNATEEFNKFIRGILKEFKSITKSHVNSFYNMLEISQNWEAYYDNVLIGLLKHNKFDEKQITALYIRAIWHDKLDWKLITKECYEKIKSLNFTIKAFENVFDELNEYNDFEIIFDDLTNEIYTYILNEHKTGKNSKEIVYKGITYKNIAEAMEQTGKTKQAIYKWIKTHS